MIPIFDINLNKKAKIYVNDCLKTNWISSQGIYIKKLEKAIRQFHKIKYCVVTSSCTTALHLAIRSLSLKKGDEVICPALSFISPANMILLESLNLKLVDIDKETLTLDTKLLEKKISKKTKAILIVYQFGNSADMDKIIKISKKFKLKIIEDAAEAVGSFYKKKHLGTFGDIGCLSFNGNKIITTGGGGAVITNNKNLANKIKHLTNTAKIKHKWEYIHDDIGYNFRMPSLNAALGLAQIENINIFVNAKRRLFLKYTKNFNKILGVKIFKEGKNLKSNYWLQTLIFDKKYKFLKNRLLNYCYKRKIYLRPTWRLISNLKPYNKKPKMDLSGARDIAERAINLPSSSSILINRL